MALFAIAALFSACAAQATPAAPAAPSSAVEASPTDALPPPAERLELGADVYAFRFAVGQAVLPLPCPAAQLAAWGIAVAADAEAALRPGETARVPCQAPEGGFTVTVANTGDAVLPLAECRVVGVAQSAEDEDIAPLRLPGGVGLGAARAEVLAACGEPDGWATADTDVELCYTAARHAWVRFTFGAGDRVEGFEMYRVEEPPAPPEEGDLPPEVLAYQPPEALGGDAWSLGIDYGGQLYTLPAPVAAFLANGWALRDEGTVPADGWMRGVSLTWRNQVLRTTLYNPSGTEQPLAGCFVTMVEYSRHSTRVPLLLPGGAGADGTSPETLAAVLGAPTSVYYSVNGNERYYDGAAGRFVAIFTPGEDEGSEELFELEVYANY